MMQQLRFTRADESERGGPVWSSSDNGSPRRVTFAVHNAPPSPVVYRAQQSRQLEAEDPVADPNVSILRIEPQRRPGNRQKPQRSTNAIANTARRRIKTQRPGWDTEVSHGSSLFDASLKKSLLFQPRAGDRRKQEEQQDQAPVVNKAAKSVRKQVATVARTPVKYRSGPSSVYAQQRRTVTQWPQRPRKDFVRENIERLTGRPMGASTARSGERSPSRGNVFERLSTPRVNKTLQRYRMLEIHAEGKHDLEPEKSKGVSSVSPRRSTPSPVLMIDPSAPVQHNSPRSATPSPSAAGKRSSPAWSQRSQRSHSPRQSPVPRPTSTSRNIRDGRRDRQQQDNYPAQVFRVLDREHERRIRVNQILQGLRLLGLPATHNQISDYVYLIHEGRHNTIDLEEWEILVGTLDAASRPASTSPQDAHTPQGSAAPSRSPTLHSPHERSLQPSSRSPHSRSPSPKTRDRLAAEAESSNRREFTSQEDEHYTASFQREPIVSAQHQTIYDDDTYLEEIQHRIEGMFERAQATAAMRWAPEPGNNQLDNNLSHSDRILKHAATVVYSLRTSLFPLVHQAEATLREIQQRHGSKLSLFLPPSDMAAIAQNSDVLASAILDDILLDTVQLLNADDQHKSRLQLDVRHADQLDEILARIENIEKEENNLIRQGFVLSYETPRTKCELPNVLVGKTEASIPGGNPHTHNIANLTLPLEVVMNINVPEGKRSSPPSQIIPDAVGNEGKDPDFHNNLHLGETEVTPDTSLFVGLPPTTTSVMQGKRLVSIEKRRHKFQQHRRIVEASLAETGMSQCAVIEILEDMLLDDLMLEATAELSNTVVSMSDTLLTSLL